VPASVGGHADVVTIEKRIAFRELNTRRDRRRDVGLAEIFPFERRRDAAVSRHGMGE
jgi:hypothetical protein